MKEGLWYTAKLNGPECLLTYTIKGRGKESIISMGVDIGCYYLAEGKPKYRCTVKYASLSYNNIQYIDVVQIKFGKYDYIIYEDNPLQSKSETFNIYPASPSLIGKYYNVRITVTDSVQLNFGLGLNRGLNNILLRSDVKGTYTQKTTASPNTNPRGMLGDCPKITILARTEVLFGENVTMVFFQQGDREYAHRPFLTSVVKGNECTLMQKIVAFGTTEPLFDGIVEYGMLRYFLWFLIKCKWDIRILLRRNTDLFFETLAKSEYACWVPYFNSSSIKGYDRYFKD